MSDEFQIVLMVLAINAAVLGIVLGAAYLINRAARRSRADRSNAGNGGGLSSA